MVAFFNVAASQDRDLHRSQESRADSEETIGVVGRSARHADGQSVFPSDQGRTGKAGTAHSYNADARSRCVDFRAGAMPNNTPVISESAAVTPRTCQFNSAFKVTRCGPPASSRVRKRIPQIAKSTPPTPPSNASRTLSVNN